MKGKKVNTATQTEVNTLTGIAKAMRRRAQVSSVADTAAAKPIGKPTPDSAKAHEKGRAAAGYALAEKAWRYVQNDDLTLRDLASDIIYLDNAARAQFREELNARKDAAKASTRIGMAEDNAESNISRGGQVSSAFVRISELMVISRAADVGMKPADICEWMNKYGHGVGSAKDGKVVWTDLSFANILKACRSVTESGAILRDGVMIKVADPKKRTAGRKADSPADKLRKFMLTNFNPKDLPMLANVVKQLAATVHSKVDAKTALDAMKPKKAAKKG
jgi:hypothetical protein